MLGCCTLGTLWPRKTREREAEAATTTAARALISNDSLVPEYVEGVEGEEASISSSCGSSNE